MCGRGLLQLSDIWLWFVYVCCQWSPPLKYEPGLRKCAHVYVSDIRLSECVMWVCECVRHAPVIA